MNNTNPPLVLKQPKHSSPHPIIPSKINPIFKSKAKWRCLINSDITYINKYKPKMVSTVELKRLQYPEFKSIRKLCRALTDAKRISSLAITDSWSFPQIFSKLAHLLKTTNRWKSLTLYIVKHEASPEDRLNPEQLKRLVRIRRCQDLSSLDITFNCQNKTTNNTLQRLSRQVQGLPHLKTLKLNVTSQWFEEDDNDDIHTNSSLLTFNYPKSLSSLHLHFNDTDSINTQLFLVFASNIQRCDRLDYLSFDFRGIYENNDPSEAQILASLAGKTSSLKTLDVYKVLDSRNFQANETYLKSYQYLKTLTTLRITLHLSSSEQENLILMPIFFTHLTSFTNLKSLSLALYCHDNHHPVIQNTFPSLQSLSKLEHLCLSLDSYNNIENKFLQNLALHCLCNLKHFELIFPSSNINTEGLIALFSRFKQLPQLKNICLNFKKITVNETLAQNIVHLHLTSLKIVLNDQPEKQKALLEQLAAVWKSEQRLTPLFSALCDLNSLENLSFNFSKFGVSTKEFNHFSVALKELKELRSLSLELPEFDSVNHFASLRKFLASLKELQKINSLHLTFKGDGLRNEEVKLVVSSLQDCSRYLEDLKLHFQDPKELTNEVLEFLGLGLEKLLSLKSLSLTIGYQTVFQKETIFKFIKRLANLKSLESLMLILSFWTLDLERKKIKELLIKRPNFKNLTSFRFNDIYWC